MNIDEEQLLMTDVEVKEKSKMEIYRILTTEGILFLPPVKERNYLFLKVIIEGIKMAHNSKLMNIVNKGEGSENKKCS